MRLEARASLVLRPPMLLTQYLKIWLYAIHNNMYLCITQIKDSNCIPFKY